MYVAVSPIVVVDLGWAMVVETRIRCRVNEFLLVTDDQGSDQREEGPSYLRFRCKVTVQHASRRLGGGGVAEPDPAKPPTTSECNSKRRVKHPSAFLDYDRTLEIASCAFDKLPGLSGIDLAPSNWHEYTPSVITASILQLVRDNHDRGLSEGHYRFRVYMDIEVMLVFSEPKALLRYCSEEVMQTLDTSTAASEPPCGICLHGLTSGPSRTPPLNLPCGHAFHSHCLTNWFFKGTACPICGYDLSGHAFHAHCVTKQPTCVRDEAVQQSNGKASTTIESRIRCRRSETRTEGHDGTAPLKEGPSYIRFICNITNVLASRRLGGGGLAQAENASPARTCEWMHLVDNPSSFLDYNWTREAVWRELVGLINVRRQSCLDHYYSPSNWITFTPDTVASSILQIVQANDDQGLCGGHYRFQVDMDIEVMTVYSEPKVLLRYCSATVMQTLDTTATCDPCGICLDGLTEPSKTPPLNIPCGHAFHAHCIRKWFFKGTACPMCRYDLRGLVGAPWPKRFAVT